MRSAADVRRDFLEFFRAKGHAIVPASPVVPYDDPTLLFTNAGMNQFKDVFLGAGTRSYTRCADSQPCIRAGGKHNDLDDVGHDTYHHTCFEMLGNWSFGDYFKKEAIEWAWELLTQVWKLDPTRLHPTYFGGDQAEGLEPDHEARDLWRSMPGMSPERIHPGNKKDNFWEMGDTGPCGPCSEIHIDLTPDKSGGPLVNAGDARVMEIWNLVFIQFNRGSDSKLTPLPAKHVDTGMGFERICGVLQGHCNNYATDVFLPIIHAVEHMAHHQYGGAVPRPAGSFRYSVFDAGNKGDTACRVIADHIRTLVFAITDGATPDKEGRGYVLRRILRRAVRYGWQNLGLHEPFLHKLVQTVVDTLGPAFPKLKENPQRVVETIRDEEQSFARTLDRGIALFEEAAKTAREQHNNEIRGEDAFKLHDTYGFPIDLTQIMASERGMKVDVGEYERLMEDARERARGAAGKAIDDELIPTAALCDESPKYSDSLQCDAEILTLRWGGVGEDTAIKLGTRVAFRTNQTCFYAEQGGQVSDTGVITTSTGEINVASVTRDSTSVIHRGYVTRGTIDVGQKCRMHVANQRRSTMHNHTATHLLNWSLREVLDPTGQHLNQRGSLVDPEKTRFDFSHNKPLEPAELERIEALTNDQIKRNLPVETNNNVPVAQTDAIKINGLRAVFGEKYPDQVRVVSIGVPVAKLLKNPADADWRKYSVEFCGGTHVRATGEIEKFAIVAEESVAKGIRRVVGVTGKAAQEAISNGTRLLDEVAALKSAAPETVEQSLPQLQKALADATLRVVDRAKLRDALTELQQVVKKLQKQTTAASADVTRQQVDDLLAKATKIGATTLIVADQGTEAVDNLKLAADMIKQRAGSAAILFGVRGEAGKCTLLAAVSDDLIKKGVKAGDWIKAIASIVEGGGGGPPTMAQAGGKNAAKLGEALEAGRAWISQKLQ